MEEMLCPRCSGKLTKSGNCFKCGARPIVFNKETENFHVVVKNFYRPTEDSFKSAAVHLNINLSRPFLVGESYNTKMGPDFYEIDLVSNILPLTKDGNCIFIERTENIKLK